jgi:hypothetical protein
LVSGDCLKAFKLQSKVDHFVYRPRQHDICGAGQCVKQSYSLTAPTNSRMTLLPSVIQLAALPASCASFWPRLDHDSHALSECTVHNVLPGLGRCGFKQANSLSSETAMPPPTLHSMHSMHRVCQRSAANRVAEDARGASNSCGLSKASRPY